MRRLVLTLCLLAVPATAFSQTHYCDTTPATSGTAIVGATLTIQACSDGKDSTGTVTVTPTGWKLYDGPTATTITMTKGTTSTVSGKAVYTGAYTVPATPSVHALQTSALVGTTEGAKSATFTLTGVAAVPSAPTNLTVQ